MSITWILDPMTRTLQQPAISDQLEAPTRNTLIVRNPWVPDSVFMGKMHLGGTLLMVLWCYATLLPDKPWNDYAFDLPLFIGMLLVPLIPTPFLIYRVWLIKNLSSFYFNRKTQNIYFRRRRTLVTLKWSQTAGGFFRITEYVNGSSTTRYALALAVPRADGSLHKNDCIWIPSNQPSESSFAYVAEVWEYLHQFMAHGPDQLPAAGEPNWWHAPLNAVCLTPAQAWRHYAPWRTGEPGEMQGKKLWLLPMWAVLFPYNLSVAVFWYAICRVFNVRAAPAPPEAFEGTSKVIDRNDRVENP